MTIDLSRDDIVRAYRTFAPVYNTLFGRVLDQGRRQMAKAVGQEPGCRLLEVGVGTGLALRHYPADSAVWGVDLSPEMLRKAAVAPRACSLALARMDAERLAFADETFDCVVAPYVLSVTPAPEKLLGEMRRVCRPGGRVIVLNHFQGAGVWRIAEHALSRWASRVGFRSTLSLDIFRGSGIDIESVCSTNLLGLSRIVVARRAIA